VTIDDLPGVLGVWDFMSRCTASVPWAIALDYFDENQRIPPVTAVLRELGFRVKSWD
jgi:hypothetical protein